MTFSKLATTTLVAVSFATASFAGTLTEPMVDIVEPPAEGSSASSGSGIIIPLLLLVALAAVVSSGDDDEVSEVSTAR